MEKVLFENPAGIRMRPLNKTRIQKSLREGYMFSQLEDSENCYFFSALAGASKVEKIFREFAGYFPDEAFLILECYQHGSKQNAAQPATFYSPYIPVEDLLCDLTPFFPRLIHDGFVGFGIANNRFGLELFYSEDKILTCFTGNHIRYMDLMGRHNIPFEPLLCYPDEFTHDHLSLIALSKESLPSPLEPLNDVDLDSQKFCSDLIDLFEMYPVDESLSFFLSKKEQDQIEDILTGKPLYKSLAKEDFGDLMLDWNIFVEECAQGFEGGLWEYRQNLKCRDLIQYVIESVPLPLAEKILNVIEDSDHKFYEQLLDRRKGLDLPEDIYFQAKPFWYEGVISRQSINLRRDLIKSGWYQPAI